LGSPSNRLVPLFVTEAFQENRKEADLSYNFTFRYINVVLLLSNSKLGDYVDRIYRIELEVKDIPDTERYVLYLDLCLEIDSEDITSTVLGRHHDCINSYGICVANI